MSTITLKSQTINDKALKQQQLKEGKTNSLLCLGNDDYDINILNNGCDLSFNTTYTWCVNIKYYPQPQASWIIGLVPILGCAWDSSTLAPLTALPTVDQSGGTWIWTHDVTSSATGTLSIPWGWYFDRDNDGDPGNNYGDNDTCCWNFCFTVKTINPNQITSPCSNQNYSQPINAAIKLAVYDDGTLGSWDNSGVGCQGVFPMHDTTCNQTIMYDPLIKKEIDKTKTRVYISQNSNLIIENVKPQSTIEISTIEGKKLSLTKTTNTNEILSVKDFGENQILILRIHNEKESNTFKVFNANFH